MGLVRPWYSTEVPPREVAVRVSHGEYAVRVGLERQADEPAVAHDLKNLPVDDDAYDVGSMGDGDWMHDTLDRDGDAVVVGEHLRQLAVGALQP